MKKPRPTFGFTCNQDFEQMPHARSGRFCELCQKEVHDFTEMSNQEILAFLKNRPGKVCGTRYTYQDDPAFVRDLKFPKSWKRGAFLSGLFLLTLGSPVFGQQTSPPPQVVQSDSREKLPVCEAPTWLHQDKSPQVELAESTHKPMKKPRRHVYLSLRFPFIHVVRPRRIMGDILDNPDKF